MLIRDFIPHISLRKFVQCIRIVHFQFDDISQVSVKAYPPKPEQCLHFILQGQFTTEAEDENKIHHSSIVLGGQQTSVVRKFSGQHFLDVQIVFQPSAFYQITGIPAFELTNRFINATDVFPGIHYTLDEMMHTADYNEMITIAQSFVHQLIRNAKKAEHPLDSISTQMRESITHVSMDGLARDAFLSTKQFKRKFFERTGVNPKTYARIVRFNKAFNLRNWFADSDWSYIAAKSGFTDYQHLSKDYKLFTGMTPAQFHELELQSPECTLNLAKSLYRTRAIL
ncbi:MAG: AraC family transcriptional regulator [Chitinophagaceae bacterium]|nr:AraC family transcriptional regulator [Chitinophagaceae bacterium]